MEHREAVLRLRELNAREDAAVCEIAFEMGDVALARCPKVRRGQDNEHQPELEALARESEIPLQTLTTRRHVASRIPNSLRGLFGWSVYREISTVDNDDARAALVERLRTTDGPTDSKRWTVTAVRELLDKKGTYIHSSVLLPERERYPVEQVLAADAETKAEAFAKLAVDPDVIEAAAQPVTPAQQAFEQLGAKVAEYHEAQQVVADAADPTGRQLGETAALYRLQTTVQRACREVEAIIPLVGTVPESTRALDMADLGIGADIRRWQEVGGRLEHLATHGESDLDTFVASTLKGG